MSLPDLNSCKVCVIGLGYVGLPVAAAFAKRNNCYITNERLNRKVIGYDICKQRVSELNNGIDKTNEFSPETLGSLENILFTDKFEDLLEADIFILTVPTPIDKYKKPDFSYLINASQTVGKIFKKKKQLNDKNPLSNVPIVIFESTVYPGATEEICIPAIEKESEIKCDPKNLNSEFFYGYSPERINPSDKNHKIENIKKVTSGCNEFIADWIDNFYGSVIKAGTFKASSVKVAEAAKVIENTQRDINIALMNELAIIFDKLNIKTNEVLEAARTKWNFIDFKPGLVGGHCIGVDPYYLTYKSEQSGYTPQVVLSGRRINDLMHKLIVEKIIMKLSQQGIKIKDAKFLILGITFKENCPDLRNSKVIEMIDLIKQYGALVDTLDPLVDDLAAKKAYNIKNFDDIKNNKYESVIISVPHDQFLSIPIEFWNKTIDNNSIIYDLKSILPKKIKAINL